MNRINDDEVSVSSSAVGTSSLASEFFQMPAAEILDDRWLVRLDTLEISPTAEHLPALTRKGERLIQRHQETMRLASAHALSVRFVGYGLVSRKTRVYKGPEHDWVLLNLNDDPLYLTHGKRLLAPPAVHEELGRIATTGMDFDTYFIAHEIPPSSMESGQEIPLELFEPIEHPKPVRRVNTFANYTARLWNGITHGYAKMAEAGAAALTLPLAALLALDPVLFGVHVDDSWKNGSDPIGMFYCLASWNWSEKEK